MGARLSRANEASSTAAADANPSGDDDDAAAAKTADCSGGPISILRRQRETRRGLSRHHTANQLKSSEGIHSNLFRNRSYGDFRQHLHGDLRSVSKRVSQVLGRADGFEAERNSVSYKRDFQTKYVCNLGSPLSHGRYATVTEAESFLTAQNVAVKIIRKDRLCDKKNGEKCSGENVRMEVLALKNLANQPNVVKFVDVYEDEHFFYVVMELCRGGNLLERIHKAGPMKEEQAGALLKQMLAVTRICHSHGIAHRDLKPENFVFLSDTEDYPLNLVDFGSAAFFKSGARQPFKGAVGTFNYMAPEVYDSCYGPSADVWSLGIIGYALLCSYLPFTGSSFEELRDKIKKEQIAFSQSSWEVVSEGAKDLLKKMLEKNPDSRITIADALAHPWLRQWDF